MIVAHQEAQDTESDHREMSQVTFAKETMFIKNTALEAVKEESFDD